MKPLNYIMHVVLIVAISLLGATSVFAADIQVITSGAFAEALKALDYQTYNDFIKQAKTTNPVTGVEGIDIGLLASNWKKLKDTNPSAANNLVTALGTNAEEFSSRMKQADVFAKRMKLAPETDGKIFENQTIREASAAMGAGPGGFQAGKLTQLGMDIANIFGKEKMSLRIGILAPPVPGIISKRSRVGVGLRM